MNWETAILLISTLGGLELVKYLVNLFINRKNEKRKNNAEAVKSMADAGSSVVAAEKALRDMYEETISEMRTEYVTRIEELRNANTEQNKQNLELLKAGVRKDDIIEDKTRMIRELQDGRVEDARKIGLLEKQVAYYKNWFCKREFGNGKGDCRRREPAQNPPLKFSPIEDYQASE